MRSSPRQRRLLADYQAIQSLRDESLIFDFEGRGNPPEAYRLVFRGLGVWRDQRQEVRLLDHHVILVELGAAYPRMIPNLTWQTPVFHPNVSSSGVVCLGGYGTHWVPSLTLDEMCVMLWDMIRYANFDPDSPYNREAAFWVKTQQHFSLPLDPRPLRNAVRVSSASPADHVAAAHQAATSVTAAAPGPPAPLDDIEIISAELVDVGASDMGEEIRFLE
jgi:hypothetical protein